MIESLSALLFLLFQERKTLRSVLFPAISKNKFVYRKMHRKHVLANPDLTSKSQTGFSKGHLNEKKVKCIISSLILHSFLCEHI